MKMNIGNTPQEKLAVIRYVHKKANITGLVLSMLSMVISIWTTVSDASYYGDEIFNAVLLGIGYGLLAAAISMVVARFLVWGFYWLKNISNKSGLTDVVRSYETETKTYRVNGRKVKVTEENMDSDAIAYLFLIGLFVSIFVGIYLAIKHLILEIMLKKQLKNASPPRAEPS